MRQEMISVLSDLLMFVRTEFGRVFGPSSPLAPRFEPLAIAPKRELNNLPPQAIASKQPAVSSPISFVSPLPVPQVLHEPVVMYIATMDSPCYVHPYEGYDECVTSFPYGVAVTVVSYQGRYARIQRQDVVGWVLKDDLVSDKRSVWPTLKEQVEYTSDHEVTGKIRLIIDDEFRAGRVGLDLQPGEYILYRMKIDNRTILWPLTRPRLPGSWQKILRGVAGVHIGVSPKTDSIIEWFTENGEGSVGYVEKVTADQTLMISIVGHSASGVFTTLTLTEEEWRELRPVFIEVL